MYHFVVFSCNVSLFPGSFCSQLSDSFMPSLTKPRRHRIFEVPAACHSLRQEKKLTAQTLPCCVYHHSRHSKLANTGYTTGWKVPCLGIPNNIPFANAEPCRFLFAVQMSIAAIICHANSPQRCNRSCHMPTGSTAVTRGESWYILKRPDLGKTLFVP